MDVISMYRCYFNGDRRIVDKESDKIRKNYFIFVKRLSINWRMSLKNPITEDALVMGKAFVLESQIWRIDKVYFRGNKAQHRRTINGNSSKYTDEEIKEVLKTDEKRTDL